jgi:hypothetical protein
VYLCIHFCALGLRPIAIFNEMNFLSKKKKKNVVHPIIREAQKITTKEDKKKKNSRLKISQIEKSKR